MLFETDLFQLKYEVGQIPTNLLFTIEKEVKRVAAVFGIGHLVPAEKIRISVLDRNSFDIEIGLHFGKDARPDIVAFFADQIYVISYASIFQNYSLDSYIRVILHECTHALQKIATGVPPREAVWLYEAVACFLAGQVRESAEENCNFIWEELKSDFYSVQDCYDAAYWLGKELLGGQTQGPVAALCSDLPRCEAICADAIGRRFK